MEQIALYSNFRDADDANDQISQMRISSWAGDIPQAETSYLQAELVQFVEADWELA